MIEQKTIMQSLNEALKRNEEKILALWTERTLDTYESSSFFKKSQDRFANPVGMNIREGLTALFRLLVEGAGAEQFAKPLDQIIRIRAVQQFTPSQAVAPLLDLKAAVRQVFSADKDCRHQLLELMPFEADVDRMTLQTFDLYMECRERLHKARIRELKSGSYILTDSACASALIRENLRELSPQGGCAADKA
ncbi:RsbRD N-terminal domain-containing protein [Candidatus Electronema sp. JC]|uniref:RsbRD N-terminal domain-containing protein n=1 Tax=Candidatus Electronema sp. JC TaxID=3401570 RepID=UPI003B43B4C6